MILMFHEIRILKPMDWYNTLERPFDGPLPVLPVIFSFVSQFCMETVTDVLCCAWEVWRVPPHRGAWRVEGESVCFKSGQRFVTSPPR